MTWAGSRNELRERTHCPHGHEYTPENTYRKDDGWRRCVECRRIYTREAVRKWRRANRQHDEEAA